MSGLTDEERELKRLAEVCERLTETRGLIHLGLPEVRAYLDASTPATVLRLLARIEEMDAACRDAHRALFLGGGSAASVTKAEVILEATQRK